MSDQHPNSARFHDLLSELGALHDKKQADYGRGDDPFANIRASEEWGVTPWVGAMVRLHDKVRRLQSLIKNGRLENESAEDSLKDIAVYSLIALVLYEQEQKSSQSEQQRQDEINQKLDTSHPEINSINGVRVHWDGHNWIKT